jgi:hypothetical protein
MTHNPSAFQCYSSAAVAKLAGYTDYGPPTAKTREGLVCLAIRWVNRPECNMCGPFRTRYLRPIYGTGEHRCLDCDAE